MMAQNFKDGGHIKVLAQVLWDWQASRSSVVTIKLTRLNLFFFSLISAGPNSLPQVRRTMMKTLRCLNILPLANEIARNTVQRYVLDGKTLTQRSCISKQVWFSKQFQQFEKGISVFLCPLAGETWRYQLGQISTTIRCSAMFGRIIHCIYNMIMESPLIYIINIYI